MAKGKLITAKLSKAKLVSWDKIVPKTVLSLEKDSKAAILQDRKGRPYLFVFDTFAFLDILSAIDEKLVDRLSPHEYYSKEHNPAGWLIDEIETRLPLDSTYIKSLKDAIIEAKEKGWIPIEKIEQEFKLRACLESMFCSEISAVRAKQGTTTKVYPRLDTSRRSDEVAAEMMELQ